MNTFATLLLTSFLTAFAASAHAGGFNLRNENGLVCRIEGGLASQCLPTIQTQGFAVNERVELIDRLKVYQNFRAQKAKNPALTLKVTELDTVGGAFFLTPATVDKTLQDYRRLSVRNLAMSRELAEKREGYVYIPFFASLYWQGAALMEGTIHIEGSIKLPENYALEISRELNDAAVREGIEQALQIKDFSDSTTESDLSAFRMLESTARQVHFRVIGTEGRTVDAATLSLLTGVVAPMVFGEAVYVPTLKSINNILK